MRIATTYYGSYQNWAGISDTDLDRDFARFKTDGVEVVTLCTFWNVLETTQGTYSDTVFNRLLHIGDKAKEHGLKVIHNIHTWYSGSNVPSYIGNQADTFKDATKRQDWLNFVKVFITRLDKDYVEEFQLCNELGLNQYDEPAKWINWDGSISKDTFYSWIQDTYDAGKTVTSKPLSGRYGMIQSSPTYLEDRVIRVWDSMCLNYYDGIDTQSNYAGLKNRIDRFRALGKDTWITEFGLKTINNENQRAMYEKLLGWFYELGIVLVTAWWWSPYAGPASDAIYYNIADGSGNPRPAYYELFKYVPVEKTLPIGLSSIPRKQDMGSIYTTASIDDVIAVMDAENLTIWRMSFPYSFQSWESFIQYYLDNCPYDVIVDYYHTTGKVLSDTEWAQSMARGLEIMEKFKLYSDRMWLEPQNEQLQGTLPDKVILRSQEFVTAARSAGYSNRIVSNVFWRTPLKDMAVINDPLNQFYSGQHIYFFDGGVTAVTMASAKKIMQDALDAGVKILNTEIGADTDGQQFFTELGVGMVSEFMRWGTSEDIGNAVWTMYGAYDYPKYKQLGLTFPTGGEGLSFVNETTKTVVVYKRPIVLDVKIGTVPAGGSLNVLIDESKEKLVIKDV